MNEARSAIVHSHSRFCRTESGRSPPKVSLLTVVSIWKIFTPALRMTSPMRQFEWCSAELWRSIKRAGVLQGVDVVVVAQAAVAGQAGGGALVAAVHGHEVDVHVDEQVALGRPLGDLDLLALVGLAEEREVVGVLGVEVVEQAVGGEGVVDPVAHRVAQLGLGHAPVQGEGGDEVDVVDAGRRGHVQHGLDDALADVGPAHRGQRQGDVVEGDGQLHARRQQVGQGRAVAEGVEQGLADGLVGVLQARQRLGRVDDARASDRQSLEPQRVTVVEHHRRGRAIDLEDEPGPAHRPRSCFAGPPRMRFGTQHVPSFAGAHSQ